MVAIPGAVRWTVLVAGDLTNGRFAVIEAREKHGAEPPRHVHSREDEFIYVLEGRVTFEREGERFDGGPGMWLYLPRGSQHRFSVESAEARLLVMLAPAGIEDWLRDLRLPDSPTADPNTVERLVSTAARHGVAITGP
jgi:quercetin dioxygenase-like cupin family protein